jgi:hypothetical protein
MIDEIHSRPNASAGFTAKEVYEIGAAYGLTCREIGQNFLGKSKSIGYGKYLPQSLGEEVIAAALAAGTKRRGRPPGAAKKAKVTKQPKAAKKAKEVVIDDEAEDAVEVLETENRDGAVFEWFATSEEVDAVYPDELEPQTPRQAIKPRKQRKVKVS